MTNINISHVVVDDKDSSETYHSSLENQRIEQKCIML